MACALTKKQLPIKGKSNKQTVNSIMPQLLADLWFIDRQIIDIYLSHLFSIAAATKLSELFDLFLQNSELKLRCGLGGRRKVMAIKASCGGAVRGCGAEAVDHCGSEIV